MQRRTLSMMSTFSTSICMRHFKILAPLLSITSLICYVSEHRSARHHQPLQPSISRANPSVLLLWSSLLEPTGFLVREHVYAVPRCTFKKIRTNLVPWPLGLSVARLPLMTSRVTDLWWAFGQNWRAQCTTSWNTWFTLLCWNATFLDHDVKVQHHVHCEIFGRN